jgi:hypothetical protein
MEFFLSLLVEKFEEFAHILYKLFFISFHENKSLKIIMQRLQLTNIIKNVHT